MKPRLNRHPEIEVLRQRLAKLEREMECSRRRHLSKLKLAAEVHRSLLPKPVRHDRIWIDVRYTPVEEVGGDYCQVRFPAPHLCYLTICDVTGHGVGPALLATRISSEVRFAVMECREPRDIVRLLERFLHDHFDNPELLLSFVAVRIDFQSMTLTWSGAGHPSPLLYGFAGRTIRQLSSQNPLIGLSRPDEDTFLQDTIPVHAGDRLFLFTDGLIEVFDAEEGLLSPNNFVDAVEATGDCDLFEVVDRIFQAVAIRQHGSNLDDQTLVVAEIR